MAPSANFTVSSEGATSAKRSSIFLEGHSLGVMENDSHRVPTSRSDATDSMLEIHAVSSTSSLHRTVVNCEKHPVALLELRYFGPRLHAWPLLSQPKLSSGEIFTRACKQERNLERENEIAIQVLMQGVEVARVVLQQERCRPQLSCLMTLLQVFCMCFRILNVDLHRLTPAIRHSGQVRVKRGPKRFDRLG